MNDKKRSTKQEITTISEGVGGRQHRSAPGTGGVGYLDVCTQTELPLSDPRMRELTQMALPPVLISIAELVGFDNFILIWEGLDDHFRNKNPDSGLRTGIPGFSTYQRYQRNQYIKSVHQESGCNAREIRKLMKKQLKIDVSERHIDRIIQKVGKR